MLWVSKTDEERIQSIPSVLEAKTAWIVLEKIGVTLKTVTLRKTGGQSFTV
ncbi:MAG: hypothetical protein K2I96_02915 [Lachnospiraceae bacterium]|nr:hypothetical protein [Lachnospiraceae bacterium]